MNDSVRTAALVRWLGVLALSALGLLCLLSRDVAANFIQLAVLTTLVLTLGVLKVYARDTKTIAEASAKQVTAARLTANVDVLFRLEDRFDGERMLKLRVTAARSILAGDHEAAEDLLDFFELISLFTRMEFLELKAVWNVFSYWERRYFVAMEEWIRHTHERDETFWTDLIWLDEQIQALHRKENKGQPEVITVAEIRKFLNDEAALLDEDDGEAPSVTP